jgi:D-aminopeptidase
LSGAKRLALRFAEDARTAGVDEQEVRDEVGAIENVILEALDKRAGKVDGAS